MLVRDGQVSDVPFLKQLLAQLGYPDLTEDEICVKIILHQKNGYRVLVVELNQEVIAFISLHWFEGFHFPGKIGRISAFCVDERFRGRGIGIELLHYAENLLRWSGCVKIEVTSNDRRTETHRFYHQRGYTVDSKRFVKYIGS